jgi:hypothetical protein
VTRGRLLATLAGLALLAPGCGGDHGKMIDWDLSASHTTKDVGWPKPDLTAVEISPVESLRIRFPEGRELTEKDGLVHDVTMDREGDEVTGLNVDSQPKTADDAYELALRWAREWDLPTEPIERWHERGVAGSTASTGSKPGSRLGEHGPQPALQIRHSFDDERPSLVSLEFDWGRADLGG